MIVDIAMTNHPAEMSRLCHATNTVSCPVDAKKCGRYNGESTGRLWTIPARALPTIRSSCLTRTAGAGRRNQIRFAKPATLERKVNFMTEEEKDLFDQEETPGLKVWLEDNLRILLSILVVIAIAGGIYSYSKRTEAPAVTEKAATQQKAAESNTDTSGSSTTDTQKAAPTKAANQNAKPTPEAAKAPVKVATPTPTATSSETDTAFVITAVRGQGETTLARQALADYLAKNPDSQLTKEHKIYIEDYLRKHNAFTGSVRVGTSVEFQKDLIQKAIGASKNLSGQQLNHLKQYSARVPSLS